jgi:CHAT domain-containing protein
MISKSKVEIINISDPLDNVYQKSTFFDLINSLKQNNISNYKKTAFYYYERYFKPIESSLPKSVTHIHIIPNSLIENITFDLLLTELSKSNDFSNLPYLGKKYQFSYGLSNSISSIINQKESKSNTFSIFSPSFSNKELTELKDSRNKAKSIADTYDANFVRETNATKETFQKHLENDKVLALLSHGSARIDEDEINKGVYLSNGFLNLNEVYNLKSNCDFLLLVTCESDVGYKSREGNINLARAFTAIGVKSMMLASWKIDEKSSSQIIGSFLKYLDSGCTKSEALQKAKLDYLATASPRMANPLYWAGLNITGNNETIELHQRNYWWLGLVLFFVGVVGVFIAQRYIKRHRR